MLGRDGEESLTEVKELATFAEIRDLLGIALTARITGSRAIVNSYSLPGGRRVEQMSIKELKEAWLEFKELAAVDSQTNGGVALADFENGDWSR